MSRWFRFYDEALDDPKVQKLPPPLFKAWVNLLCIASKNQGKLPAIADLAFCLRLEEKAVGKTIQELCERGLMDRDGDGWAPHNWKARQFRSDTSTERVQRHRKQGRNVTSTVSETPNETAPEQSRDRTETEIPKPAQQPSPALRDRVELDRIEGLCRQAAKLENAVSPELFNLSPILGLIDAGYSLETDILPILKAKSGKNVRTWRFFIPAIEDSRKANQQIAPPSQKPAADWLARGRFFAQTGQWLDEWGDRRSIPPEHANLFRDAA